MAERILKRDPSLKELGWKDRGEVIAAVKAGRAVRDPDLAAAAIARAVWSQSPARPWSLRWFLSFAELGPFASGAVLVVAILVGSRAGLLAVLAAGAIGVILLAPLGLRNADRRRRLAGDAERANRSLLEASKTERGGPARR